ncbi:DUF4326 domain-containing protein [Bacillus altitudinis]|uniref:DUF4326 domain-containing protein n=1 Tax=Bacillus altitudinis TaxID=293387 RepID=UPI001C21B967|nr:DUF4326 domain-containing protein [Bacillus altitudinis]MBU8855243.1 DUF4326 domain-containing protein [Bacillus sp. FJAT-26377]MCY7454320.1 DUF4326 domain-containing protein [Bacillus altitudinis]
MGKPFSHLSNTEADFKVDTREEAIEMYRRWLITQPRWVKSLRDLKGKTLGCFCSPKQCHGDILVEIANKLIEAEAYFKQEM